LLDISCSGKTLAQFLLEVDALRSTLLAADLGEADFVEMFFALRFLTVLRRTFLEEWAAIKMRAAATSVVPSFRSLADDLRLVYYDDMQTKFEHVPGANMAQSGARVCLYCDHVRGKKLPHDILDCHALENAMAARKKERASKQAQQPFPKNRSEANCAWQSNSSPKAFQATVTAASSYSGYDKQHALANSGVCLLDTGCTDHMCNSLEHMMNIVPVKKNVHLAARQSYVPVTYEGEMRLLNHLGNEITLKDVL
jgi:hypothetical protein